VYNDGGEIVEFQKYYGIYEETKVFFMSLVNSLGIVVKLYIVLQVYCQALNTKIDYNKNKEIQ